MTTLIRSVIFVFSNLGWWELLRRRLKVNMAFLPGAAIAIQTVFLFAAGILNLLTRCTYGIFAFGLISFAWFFLWKREEGLIRRYCQPEYYFLTVSMIFLAFATAGKQFSGIDNYTHWATVVKQMLRTHRFPNFMDPVIIFQGYPLGSSTFIYYVARMVSDTENIQMLAQGYMMIVALMPLFQFATNRRTRTFCVMLFATYYILVYNIVITDLLVDTLLPLVCMSGILFTCQNYGSWMDHKWENLTAISYLIWMVQIKNSGLFFVIIPACYILYTGKRDGNWVRHLTAAFAPYASIVIWQRHSGYVFNGAALATHSMSLKWYRGILQEKSVSDLKLICLSAIKWFITWKDMWIVLGGLLLVGALCGMYCPSQKEKLKKIEYATFAAFFLYALGVIAMYVFSMPMDEAVKLASIKRYFKISIIAVLYVTVGMLLVFLSEGHFRATREKVLLLLPIMVIAFYQIGTMGKLTTGFPRNQSLKSRNIVETAIVEYDLPEEESYCFLTERTNGMILFVARYLLYSSEVEQIGRATREELQGIRAKYIIIEDKENTVIQEWVRECFPDQAGNGCIINDRQFPEKAVE